MSESASAAHPEHSEPAYAETSVEISAELDRVWNALVTDGGLEPWMGEGATIDPQPGGRLILPDVVGGRPRAGMVGRIERNKNLDFTWWPITRPSERSNVSIIVTPIETGTLVTVREAPVPAVQATARTRGAWAWRLAVLTLTCQAALV